MWGGVWRYVGPKITKVGLPCETAMSPRRNLQIGEDIWGGGVLQIVARILGVEWRPTSVSSRWHCGGRRVAVSSQGLRIEYNNQRVCVWTVECKTHSTSSVGFMSKLCFRYSDFLFFYFWSGMPTWDHGTKLHTQQGFSPDALKQQSG